MRFFLAFLFAALQISSANAVLRLNKCGTTFPAEWVSNCSPADQQGCKDLCGQKASSRNLVTRIQGGASRGAHGPS
ncbi:hypothetical protein CKAH01_01241 [Colletotrichum kahawae]|uniref:Uncharacterized protein n=1 Tax=Colletotrichum kahawae TaxID=34407 RepID=A0AAE0D5A1_COLKA|nr:hypothetical protein CKAH01_01241 [Colletotrichum kahawae]